MSGVTGELELGRSVARGERARARTRYAWLRRGSRAQFGACLLVLVYGCVLLWLRPEVFETWIREDGPVENLTAGVFALAALLAFTTSWRWRALDRTRARVWLALCGILLFGALEEISWGQRIFGWESPAWFQLYNAQGETNLHNLRFYGVKLNKLVFGKGLALLVLLYIGILPLLDRRVARVRAFVDRLALPLVRAWHLALYLGALALLRVPLSLLEDSRAMEMGELVGGSLALAMLADPRNREAIAPPLERSQRPLRRGWPRLALPSVRLLLLLLGLHFATFALYRVAFWLAFRGPDSAADAVDVARALSLGLRFDLRLAAFIVLPLFALGGLRRLSPLASRAAHVGWVAYFTVIATVTSLLYLADFAHYGWVDRRIDVSVLEYAWPVGTALQVVWETYPVVPLLLGLGAFLAGWAMAVSRSMRWLAARGARQRAPRYAAVRLLAVAALLALGVVGRVGGYPLRWSHAFFTPDAFACALGLNPVLYLIDTLPYASSGADVDAAAAEHAYRELSGYLGIESPPPSGIDVRRHVEPRAALPVRPNVVVIQLESFGANKVGAFGNPLDPTPNFDRIARESLLFTSFYTASRGTARSTFSLLTGIPDVTRRGSRNPLIVDQHVLVDDFRGYEKLYFYTGDLAWGNIRGLLQNNISGLRVFEEKDYRSPRNDGWGISDLHLFDEANAVFRDLGERPFIAFLHTSGNHRPYTIPADRRGFEPRRVPQARLRENGFRSQQEFDSLRFMDHSLGQFLALARREPYFDRTLFLILGDHGSTGSGTSAWQKIGLTAIHVPFAIYGPALVAARRVDEPASSLDVLPTVAALAGIPHVNTALGRDLLSPRRDGESFVFSEAGLVDREFFFADGALYRLRSGAPTADVGAEFPERRERMAKLWTDFHDLALYLMQNNGKQPPSAAVAASAR